MDKHILLVDDEEGIRKVLGISLADIGYQVHTAADGKEGLALFRKHNPPIIITDIKMPVMDGINLLKHIKKENADTEVIMLTGHGDMDLAIECLKLEATDFITKPVNDEVLEIALKRAGERILMRRQLREYTENLERLVKEKSARLVAAERRTAVGQALEGITSAFQDIAGDLDAGIQYFNELPCFVSLHSPRLKVVAANERYVTNLGDQTGRPSWRIYTPKGKPAEPGPVETTFKTGQGQRRQTTVTFKDGTETPVIVHTAPIRNADGKVELVVEIAADVAEIRRLQEALRTSQQRYEQLFNEAPCYITVQDRQLNITAANRQFREDFGMATGSFCYKIYQQRTEACPNCPVQRTFDDGLPHQCELDATDRNGNLHRLLIWTASIKDSTGRMTHVMEMATDVTRMRQLQDQLAGLGLMIGSVSHGIKGLLTGLDGGIYDLDSGFERQDLDRVKGGWQTVRLMISRIRSLVLDILFYAKEKDLKWERLAVLDFAEDVAGLNQPKADRHAIQFRCEFDPKLKEFEVDAGFMRATLTNIMENAIAACVADPDQTKAHQIDFKVHQDRSHIIFTIKDNGIGMDAATREKIFTPLFISNKEAGTGLGLFVAGRILKKNNGEITVASEPGQGSCFTIRLPKTAPSANDAAEGNS